MLTASAFRGIGHLAVQYAKAMGFNTVAISSSDAKRELAGRLGASHFVDSSKEPPAKALQTLGGAQMIVCAAPNEKIIEEVLMGLGPNGTLLIIALARASVSIPICQYLSIFRHLLFICCFGWLGGWLIFDLLLQSLL